MLVKKNFGFETQAGRRIDLDGTDNALAVEIDRTVSGWKACISCGSCTATCPAGINFRKFHYHVKLSTTELTPRSISNHNLSAQVLTTLNSLPPQLSINDEGKLPLNDEGKLPLYSCFLCGKCQLVCPRGIPTRYLAIQIIEKTKHYAEGIPSV
jgi:ferredoxin